MGSGLNAIGGAVNNVLGGAGSMIGGATGYKPASSARPYDKIDPYKEYSPTKILGKEINVNDLNSQIAKNAGYQRDQNVAGFNAAVGSQRGVNPALSAMIMGNNLANQNQVTAQNVNNQIAQNNYNASVYNSQLDLQSQMANNQFGLQAYGINSGNYNYVNALNSQNFNYAQGINAGAGERAADRGAGLIGGIISGGSQALASSAASAAVFSDENLKEAPQEDEDFWEYLMGNKKEEGFLNKKKNEKNKPSEIKEDDHHINEFLNRLTPHLFSYKSGTAADDGGRTHMGIMAQDLEKTEIGKSMVQMTPEGRMIDTNQLSGALAASIGALHRRMLKLEDMKRG